MSESTVAICGVGITGLVCALMLEMEGYEVIMYEKRELPYERKTFLSLYEEVDVIFRKLGILEQFQETVGTHICAHNYYCCGKNVSNIESIDYIDTNVLDLDTTNLDKLFTRNSKYIVSIASLQRFLVGIAISRGICVNIGVNVELVERDNECGLVINDASPIFPTLIVVADGANGSLQSSDSNQNVYSIVDENHPCKKEAWLFGIFPSNTDISHNKHLWENIALPDGKPFLELMDVMFDAKNKNMILYVSVPSNISFSSKEIEFRLRKAFEKVMKLCDVEFKKDYSTGEVNLDNVNSLHFRYFYENSIRIVNRCLSKHTANSNVLFAGDRCGSSSPLAGLGATLGCTVYPTAVSEVAKRFKEIKSRVLEGRQGREKEDILEEYRNTTSRAVLRWHSKAAQVRHDLENATNIK